MKKFLYLCLLGTALAGTSAYSASVKWGEAAGSTVLPSNSGKALSDGIVQAGLSDSSSAASSSSAIVSPSTNSSTYTPYVAGSGGTSVNNPVSVSVDPKLTSDVGVGGTTQSPVNVTPVSGASSTGAVASTDKVYDSGTIEVPATKIEADYSGSFSGYELNGDLVTGDGTFQGLGNGLYLGPNDSGYYKFDGANLVKADVNGNPISGATGSSGGVSSSGRQDWTGVENGQDYAHKGDLYTGEDGQTHVATEDGPLASDNSGNASGTGGDSSSGQQDWTGVENGQDYAHKGDLYTDENGEVKVATEDGPLASDNSGNASGTGGDSSSGQQDWTGVENGQDYAKKGDLYTDENGETKVATEDGKLANKEGTSGAVQQKNSQQSAKSEEEKLAAATKATTGLIDKAVIFNVGEYALQIMQALEGTNQDDITKDVTVEAEKLHEAQSSSSASSGTEVNASLSGSGIATAAQNMISLLNANQIDLSLLEADECVSKEAEATQGSGGQSGQGSVDRTGEAACIYKHHRLFAQDAALSAQMIAEGSNAISQQFYDRVDSLAVAAGSTVGTMGALSVLNDSERYPYFEMVRGSALSAVQLWLKGASTYSELDATLNEGENNG